MKGARAIYEEVGRRREALNAPVMREEVDRWAGERRGRKHRMWRRTLEETWKTRKVEEAEIWEVKEGEKMRWEMQFKEQEWPGMKKSKENKDKWNRLEKEERGAIEEIKWGRRGLKKVRGEMILRLVNDGENEEIESMYIEMLARTEEWMRNPEKMMEHIAKEKEWKNLKSAVKDRILEREVKGRKFRMYILEKWETEEGRRESRMEVEEGEVKEGRGKGKGKGKKREKRKKEVEQEENKEEQNGGRTKKRKRTEKKEGGTTERNRTMEEGSRTEGEKGRRKEKGVRIWMDKRR